MFFGLRQNLLEVHLGRWVYDDLIIYMSEICKELEIVEINSDMVTDLSIAELLKKSKYLRFLDLSGCDKFFGVAFSEVKDNIGSSKIRKITLGRNFTTSFELTAVKKLIHEK